MNDVVCFFSEQWSLSRGELILGQPILVRDYSSQDPERFLILEDLSEGFCSAWNDVIETVSMGLTMAHVFFCQVMKSRDLKQPVASGWSVFSCFKHDHKFKLKHILTPRMFSSSVQLLSLLNLKNNKLGAAVSIRYMSRHRDTETWSKLLWGYDNKLRWVQWKQNKGCCDNLVPLFRPDPPSFE